MSPRLDVARCRAAFPSLATSDWVYLDNAGGSQCLGRVADRVRDYLLNTNVQLGASYRPSVEAGARVAEATASLADWIGAASADEVVVGPSTTQLMMQFAESFARWLRPGDEVVVTDLDHEANIGPWRRLEERGLSVKTWRVDERTWELRGEDLEPLLGDRTRLVCFTAASNVTGSITPVKPLVELVHAHGALACVDAVAFAPHRLPEPRDWGADLVAFSLYKTYGPHAAVLRAPAPLLRELPGVNHFFIGDDAGPAKFQPGNVNYELTWGAGAVVDYLEEIGASVEPDPPGEARGGGGAEARRDGGADARERDSDEESRRDAGEEAPGGGSRRGRLGAACEAIATHEQDLAARLLDHLNGRGDVTVWGRREADAMRRVPTISFTISGRTSRSVVEHLDSRRLGARHGHFYARHLVERMGLEPDDGVVRVSMVHVNTLEEVDRLVEALSEVT